MCLYLCQTSGCEHAHYNAIAIHRHVIFNKNNNNLALNCLSYLEMIKILILILLDRKWTIDH